MKEFPGLHVHVCSCVRVYSFVHVCRWWEKITIRQRKLERKRRMRERTVAIIY